MNNDSINDIDFDAIEKEAFSRKAVFGSFEGISAVFAVALLGLILSPWIVPLLTEYRAVVLKQDKNSTFIGFDSKYPKSISKLENTSEGTIIKKDFLGLTPYEVEATDDDFELLRQYKIYSDSFEGEIIEILTPRVQGGASSARIKTKAGKEVIYELWGQHLSGAAIGRSIQKKSGSWEPILLN